MRIGVPTEIKNNENRVAMTPAAVDALVRRGHTVTVQRGAGLGSAFTDDAYRAAGAQIADTAEETWGGAEMVVKVKEPVKGVKVVVTYNPVWFEDLGGLESARSAGLDWVQLG